MGNHCGTHVDTPSHFFNNGKGVSEYPAKFWWFNHPCVLNIRAGKNRVINKEHFYGKIKGACDILIIKTGFGALRGRKSYSFENPIIHPEAAMWLRLNKPNIRAVGFDFVSAGSMSNRAMGREAHRAFLSPKGEGSPILLFEDMDLSQEIRGLKRVCALPIRIKHIDSAPCTILGFL